MRYSSVDHRRTPQSRDQDHSTNSARKPSAKKEPRRNLYSQYDAITTSDRRTTLRRSTSVSNLRTPERRQPNPSEQNRKCCGENIHKIQNFLQNNENLFGHLYINNLKSITAKQFVDFILICMKNISGKTMASAKLSDVECEILTFMKTLNYPQTINKSWLKAPNIPHSFPDCMALLAWLSEFWTNTDNYDEPETDDGIEMIEFDPEFPNRQFIKYFSVEINRGFQLWNEQNDEAFEQWKSGMIEQHVVASLENRVNSLPDLISLTQKLQNQITKMKTYDFTIPNVQQFEVIETQVRQREETLRSLQTMNITKCDRLAAIKLKLSENLSYQNERQKSIDYLKDRISKQCCTIDEYRAAGIQLSTLRQNVEIEKNSITTIKNDNMSLQVHLARLIHRKNDEISKLNQFIYKICQFLARSKFNTNISIDPRAYHIELNDTYDKVCSKAKNIYVLYGEIQCKRQYVESTIEQNQLKFIELQKNEQQLLIENDIQCEKWKLLQNQQNVFNENEMQKSKCLYTMIDGLVDEFELLLLNKNQMNEQIDENLKQITNLKLETAEMYNNFEEQAAVLLEMKNQWINQLDNAINDIQNVNDEELND